MNRLGWNFARLLLIPLLIFRAILNKFRRLRTENQNFRFSIFQQWAIQKSIKGKGASGLAGPSLALPLIQVNLGACWDPCRGSKTYPTAPPPRTYAGTALCARHANEIFCHCQDLLFRCHKFWVGNVRICVLLLMTCTWAWVVGAGLLCQFLGVTAFPNSSTTGKVFGLRAKRLLRQFEGKKKWYDYEDPYFYSEEDFDKNTPWSPEVAQRLDRATQFRKVPFWWDFHFPSFFVLFLRICCLDNWDVLYDRTCFFSE